MIRRGRPRAGVTDLRTMLRRSHRRGLDRYAISAVLAWANRTRTELPASEPAFGDTPAGVVLCGTIARNRSEASTMRSSIDIAMRSSGVVEGCTHVRLRVELVVCPPSG